VNKSEMIFYEHCKSSRKILHIGRYWGPYIPKEYNVENVVCPLWCAPNHYFRKDDRVYRPADRPEGYRLCKNCLRLGQNQLWIPISSFGLSRILEEKLGNLGVVLEPCRKDGARLVMLFHYLGHNTPECDEWTPAHLAFIYKIKGEGYREDVLLYDFDKLQWCYGDACREVDSPDKDRLYEYITDKLVNRALGIAPAEINTIACWQDEGEEALFS